MRIILDTGVFYYPAALREAARQGLDVVVPAVAFTERARHLVRAGGSAEAFLRLLIDHGFLVEAFGPKEGLRVASRMAEDALWRRHARDAMIAGHVGPEDILWTTNRGDFERLGLDPHQLQDVP